ncbi:hypothetical protein [Nocardia sp. BMG51109]|uniref:hypothetical protein n=1 Tax=Nocardia sp. BMG51109 TaxID=1056816 RepID=UPI000467AEB2|nr:hypothetical protein [Nocardia sp. BMG51109]
MPSRPWDADDHPADASSALSSDKPGCSPDELSSCSPDELSSLIEFGTARLADTPAVAEATLRRAAAAGEGVLPADRLARLYSLIVTAICGQPGRDADLAAAALTAAEHWRGLSPADAAHHTLLAARIYYRTRRYRDAVPLYRTALAHPDIPYPAPQIAVLHEQFGECLNALHRYRSAAREFTRGAQWVAGTPGCRELHADLLSSAAAAHAATRPPAVLRRLATELVKRRRSAPSHHTTDPGSPS